LQLGQRQDHQQRSERFDVLALRGVRPDLERKPTAARMAQAVRPIQLDEQFATTQTLRITTTDGTIKRLTDRSFGFIATAEGTEYFCHRRRYALVEGAEVLASAHVFAEKFLRDRNSRIL